jgi:hypothetical protein
MVFPIITGLSFFGWRGGLNLCLIATISFAFQHNRLLFISEACISVILLRKQYAIKLLKSKQFSYLQSHPITQNSKNYGTIVCEQLS